MKFNFDDIEYCKPEGIFEDEYVYDIEVDDDTHTFIANDMLVHNSLYLSYKPIMDSIGYTGDPLEFILHFDKVFIKKLHDGFLEEYANKFKVKNMHDFELENINKSSLHIEKKLYMKNTVWEDGIFYKNMSAFKITGIKIIRSSTPAFVRGKNQEGGIWNFIKYIFEVDKPEIMEILKIVKDLRKEFDLQDISDISMSTSCTDYTVHVVDDVNDIIVTKGSNFSIKAAAMHNYLLNRNSEFKTKYDTIKGGKINYYYCKHPKNNVFGYLRGFHPTEITDKEKVIFDYDTQFEKAVLSIVNDFLKPMGLPLINKRLSVLGSLFSFKM